jgi:poly-gamma-glutamate capsule biosynthesis protein CapA/YwtB (metallophosphatase superfamily)
VHYRMNPDNLPGLLVARPDACALANNHVLDLGRAGLAETVDALAGAGLRAAGAGRDAAEARRPAAVPAPGSGRIVVFSCGAASSGIPDDWAATANRSGVDFLPAASDAVADGLIARLREVKRPGDVVVVSIHWGSNWGYRVDDDQVRFARRLIDGGADLIHGHSSHHPRPVEVYRGKLVLYGCGDFIDDYEGIGGYEEFRHDLRLLYLASVAEDTGTLDALQLVPMQASRMRLRHAGSEDGEWLRGVLEAISSGFGTRVGHLPGGLLVVRPTPP